MTQAEPIWWEKTVEYSYARAMLGEMWAAPLAGKSEHAVGDLVQANQGAFALIEFKRKRATVNSEWRKYPALQQSEPGYYADQLRAIYPTLFQMSGANAHWIVYGEWKPAAGEIDRGDLHLNAIAYCAKQDGAAQALQASQSLAGVNGASLFQYMCVLAALRGQSDFQGTGSLVFVQSEGESILLSPSEFETIASPHVPRPAAIPQQSAARRQYAVPRG